MFFPWREKNICDGQKRKAIHILPARNNVIPARGRRFSAIGKKADNKKVRAVTGSMTLEAACVLPMFLSVMIFVIQFAKIMIVSSALLAGMQSTAKDMAASAYIQELGFLPENSGVTELITGGVSAVYARSQITKSSGLEAGDGTWSLLQSGFMKDEKIDLAVSYTPKQMLVLIPLPKLKASLRARVRAWTGRTGSGGDGETGSGEEAAEEQEVYVTPTGKVYHTDENCSHIKLSIQMVPKESLGEKRNAAGEKYHACELCSGGNGSAVYITDYGNRYHSSLTCSGLKRNVMKIPLSQMEGWKCCSKCAGK